MRTAFGALGWKPAEFWGSTLTEFLQAVEGWNEANGVKRSDDAPSNKQLEALMAKYG